MFVEVLTDTMISAGKELTRRLDAAGFRVDASLWSYSPESNSWHLIIASPEIKLRGPRRTYSKIQSILSKAPKAREEISLSDISVVESNAPLIKLLRVAIKTGRTISDIRFSRNTINGVFIEDAYIYRIT